LGEHIDLSLGRFDTGFDLVGKGKEGFDAGDD